jgi:hypothetical protein
MLLELPRHYLRILYPQDDQHLGQIPPKVEGYKTTHSNSEEHHSSANRSIRPATSQRSQRLIKSYSLVGVRKQLIE